MFKFKREQHVFDIAGVRIGGQPGQLPTVMIGSIFYHRHKIVLDEKTGKFNKKKAEKLLNFEKETSNKTGNPRIVDICCSYPQAFEKFIDFIAEKTQDPFAIDGTTAEVRIAGSKYIGEAGLSKRAIYNSITPHTTKQEIEALKESKIKSAILLTLNSRNPTIMGRLLALEKILPLAKEVDTENLLVDTAVFDIPDPGPVSKTIQLVKDNYGFPAGAGTHNSIERWTAVCDLDATQRLLASTVANVFSIALGADFLLYGPIERAASAYYICAIADAFVAYSAKQEFGIQPTRPHPLFKIFRK